jgi:hypothetical protein
MLCMHSDETCGWCSSSGVCSTGSSSGPLSCASSLDWAGTCSSVSITVTFPSSLEPSFVTGSTLQIQFTVNAVTAVTLRLIAFPDDTIELIIASTMSVSPGLNSYNWQIPADQTVGRYGISIVDNSPGRMFAQIGDPLYEGSGYIEAVTLSTNSFGIFGPAMVFIVSCTFSIFWQSSVDPFSQAWPSLLVSSSPHLNRLHCSPPILAHVYACRSH